jgi:hypothetical protein
MEDFIHLGRKWYKYDKRSSDNLQNKYFHSNVNTPYYPKAVSLNSLEKELIVQNIKNLYHACISKEDLRKFLQKDFVPKFKPNDLVKVTDVAARYPSYRHLYELYNIYTTPDDYSNEFHSEEYSDYIFTVVDTIRHPSNNFPVITLVKAKHNGKDYYVFFNEDVLKAYKAEPCNIDGEFVGEEKLLTFAECKYEYRFLYTYFDNGNANNVVFWNEYCYSDKDFTGSQRPLTNKEYFYYCKYKEDDLTKYSEKYGITFKGDALRKGQKVEHKVYPEVLIIEEATSFPDVSESLISSRFESKWKEKKKDLNNLNKSLPNLTIKELDLKSNRIKKAKNKLIFLDCESMFNN